MQYDRLRPSLGPQASHPTSLYLSFPIYKVKRLMATLPTSQEAITVQKHAKRIRTTTSWKHSQSGWLGKESGAFGGPGLLAALTFPSCCSILMAGILPFGAMFIELFFIFSVSTAACPAAPHSLHPRSPGLST